MDGKDMIRDLYVRYGEELEMVRRNLNEAFHLIPVNGNLYEILGDIAANPGKMLRPLLMLLVAGDCSDDEKKELLATAASMEMIHNASLILDDMLDCAEVRRGQATVVAKYGAPVALCVGEFILAAAYRYLQGLGYYKSSLEVMDITQKACNGEMIQNINRGNTEVTEEDYIEAVRGKTAALFSVICESACRITNRDKEVTSAMAELGEMLGIMFQLRDDLLDLTATREELGKPVNEDFTDKVYTLPVIYAFRDREAGGELIRMADKEELNPAELMEVRKLVSKAGGIDYARQYMNKLSQRGRELLDYLPDQANRKAMEHIIVMLEMQQDDGKTSL